jgi:hypothetical protein
MDQHLRHLGGHRQEGVQGRHRILEDHGDVRSADPVELAHRKPQQLPPTEAHAARGLAVVRQQPHDAQHRLGLARARLAHDPQRLTLAQGEADPVDGLDGAVGGLEADFQVVDFEQGHGF